LNVLSRRKVVKMPRTTDLEKSKSKKEKKKANQVK
jgi:hypothetical protein